MNFYFYFVTQRNFINFFLFLLLSFPFEFQIDGVSDTKLTRHDVRAQVIRLAKSLSSVYGVKEGDVIGLCSENRLEFPVIVFAAFVLGATIAPLNVTYTDRKWSRK